MKTASSKTRCLTFWKTLLIGLSIIGSGTVFGCTEQQSTSQSANGSVQANASLATETGYVSVSFASQREVEGAFERL